MRKLNLTFFTLLCSLFIYGQKSPESLTLQEAIGYGLIHNTNLQTASLDLQKAYKDRWEVIARGLPQLSASTSYQNFIEQPVSLIPAEFFGGQPGEFAEIQFGTPQNFVAGARVEQLIFDGSYIVGLQASKVYLNISENILEKTQLEITKAITDSYCTVLLADENVRLLEKNSANLGDNLRETTKLFENGFAEEEDVEQLKLTLSKVNSQLDYAQNLQKLTRSLLKLTLGYPDDQALILSDQLEALAVTQMNPIQNNTPDLSNNIDLKIAQNNRDSEKLLLRLERSKALPTLRAFVNGNYTGNSDGFTFLDSDQKWFGSSLLGVNLNIPIFSSLGRTAASQKAKIALEQAENNLALTQEQIQLQYLQARNDFELAVKNYASSKNNLALAERIEQKNQIKYTEGMASSFELRQAQTQLYAAQSEYLNAMKEVVVKKTHLQTLVNTPN
jgi:outer membrane protein TolC